MSRPRDHRDAAQDLTPLEGEAYNWLSGPEYGAVRHRLEDAHASVEATAVEARRRVRLNEGRER
jgi:hypothetical protein